MTCSCRTPKWLYTSYSKTCQGCGTETHGVYSIGPENTSYGDMYEPVYQCGYSRKKRMSTMIDGLFFPSASAVDEPVLKCFERRAKFNTIPELCNFLKKQLPFHQQQPDKWKGSSIVWAMRSVFRNDHSFYQHVVQSYKWYFPGLCIDNNPRKLFPCDWWCKYFAQTIPASNNFDREAAENRIVPASFLHFSND